MRSFQFSVKDFWSLCQRKTSYDRDALSCQLISNVGGIATKICQGSEVRLSWILKLSTPAACQIWCFISFEGLDSQPTTFKQRRNGKTLLQLADSIFVVNHYHSTNSNIYDENNKCINLLHTL